MTSLVLAALIALGFIDQQVTDVLTRERLEPMLAEESPRLIEATFARHPDAVLPFIDSYFEGGLAMIEEGNSLAGQREALVDCSSLPAGTYVVMLRSGEGAATVKLTVVH